MKSVDRTKLIDTEDITSPYYALLQQINSYASLEDWWSAQIVSPTLRQVVPQLIAFIILEGIILYSHNWLAAFLCAAMIISKTYQTIISLSLSMMHAYLITQIRQSFLKGISIGESNVKN